MLRYNCSVTAPDIPELYMYERMDVKVPPTGHTYLPNDTGFGASTRADEQGVKMNMSEFHWFNYGYGELVGPNGPVVPVSDPCFTLYDGPLPLPQAKVVDLHILSKFLPDPAKRALYPPYIEGVTNCRVEEEDATPPVSESESEQEERGQDGEDDESSSSDEAPLADRRARVLGA
ncbi:hypothetical protein CYMTET_52852 [Cymbomonas tetramitiformis]|uniref:Uncharacterized protein n=1 Tax=Cymbomonas tetramitiformis TaxID=36881 RepID=A0AAE0BIF3_9CHLO|nr:hypothetical protein CYMTET_52852 [Cymbomonas tetramitiformis]